MDLHTLTPRRAADRVHLAAAIAERARALGMLPTVRQESGSAGFVARVNATLEHPCGLCVSFTLYAEHPGRAPLPVVLHWYTAVRSPLRLSSTVFRGVNPHHRAKATHICPDLSTALADVKDVCGGVARGEAFEVPA